MITNKLEFINSLSETITNTKNNVILFSTLLQRINIAYNFDICGISVIDKDRENIGFGVGTLENANNDLFGDFWYNTISATKLPFYLQFANNEILTVNASFFYTLKKRNEWQSEFEKVLKDKNVTELYFIPLKTKEELVGYLILSLKELSFNKSENDFLILIAGLLASVVYGARAEDELRHLEKERELRIKLFEIIVTLKDKNQFLNVLVNNINNIIPSDYIGLYASDTESNQHIYFSYIKNSEKKFKSSPISVETQNSFKVLREEFASINNDYIEFTGLELENICKKSIYLKKVKESNLISSFLMIKYSVKNKGALNLVLGRKEAHKPKREIDYLFWYDINSFFGLKEIDLVHHLLPQIALMLGFYYMFDEISILTKKLEQEKSYLLEEINFSNTFQEIIGNSSAIQTTLNKVTQVAALEATVLIQGETGTGKELIAKAVHNLSKRKNNAFITVNCAALPAQLIESELFGHEKGSFTGAYEKRIGKFEIADGGTIFLDEIGELPIEIQSKLLRVLQEKKFERVGGRETISSDVRIISATNRNLEKEISLGKFRPDLFFRLNVFPIVVPPLRERKEDIPSLVKHFVDIFSKRIGSAVKLIKKTDMELLMEYNWPGNIRELEHLIERSIIISKGDHLNFENYLFENKGLKQDISEFKTLINIEKEHIIEALNLTNGKVTGEKSASQLLGINGKTLGSKMKKLGIKREVVIIAK